MNNVPVYLLSLGCAKNLVDSEVMEGALRRDGFIITNDPAEAVAIIINTCGFIESAKQESIANILELAEYKQIGCCRVLAAVGCMVQKYATEMQEAMPEIDLVMGSRDYQQISRLLRDRLNLPDASAPVTDPYELRVLPPGSGSAYLKIAEGCNNRCSYCLIPQLRGPYISRPREQILAEAQRLAANNIKELIVIAQDPTKYGHDLYGKYCLPELLDALAKLPFAMIRLMYAYPDMIDDELLQVMAKHDNICHYLDIPLQHASDHVLRAMHRHGSRDQLRETIARIRRYLPDASLRTTVMVGFPGETEQDVELLLGFLAETQFDWTGAFTYCQEEDTPAAKLPDQIEQSVKEQRYAQVMEQAAEITAARLQRFVGRTLTVLAEQPAPERGANVYAGRSAYQAPDVDGVIFFTAATPIICGELYNVKITASDIYDLAGEA